MQKYKVGLFSTLDDSRAKSWASKIEFVISLLVSLLQEVYFRREVMIINQARIFRQFFVEG